MKPILLPGDVFAVENPDALGWLIRLGERFRDNEKSEYSHAGIITDSSGTTLEALWTVRGNFIYRYKGKKIIIGRYKYMNKFNLEDGFEGISAEINEDYPVWRLFLMLIPKMAYTISNGRWAVCSELVCKFLMSAGLNLIHWQDRDPQYVADVIRNNKSMELIYEGTW